LDKHARILVVDDDKEITETIRAILEDEGYLVDVAATGNDAVKMTQDQAYDLAILDIRLPDMEGVKLLTLMKDAVPRMRKIMLTGYPSLQNAVSALNNKADAYLIKPVNLEKLLRLVREQLIEQENEREFSEEKVAAFIESRAKEIPYTL